MAGWSRRWAAWLLAGWAALAAGTAVGQGEGIRLVVPFGPGGASDVLFRELGEAVEPHLGRPVRVENLPGGGGVRGAMRVKQAEPDGRILLGSHQTLILSHLIGLSPFSHDALAPVALLARTVNIPAAHRQLGIETAAELVAHLRRFPGDLRVGMIHGATDEFFWRQFLVEADLPSSALVWVGYPDTGSQVAGLLAGEIDLSMLNLPSARELFADGALVPLGVADGERLSVLPEVPTLREQGIDLVNTTDRGLFAPPGTTVEVLRPIARAFEAVLSDEGLVARLEREHGTRVDFRPLVAYGAYLERQEAVLRPLVEAGEHGPVFR